MKKDDDLHFSTDEKELDKKIDKELEKFNKDAEQLNILDKIQDEPPSPGYMGVKLGADSEPGDDGVYEIDLNVLLAADLAQCPGTVIPVLLDNTVQTAFEKRDAYRSEKRKLDFQWIWILILIIGVGVFILVLFSILPGVLKGIHL
jgi:hypothetical protein